MRTAIPIAPRRTFVGLGAGVLRGALSASARGAMASALAAIPPAGHIGNQKSFDAFGRL
jgi:hypothetical protein